MRYFALIDPQTLQLNGPGGVNHLLPGAVTRRLHVWRSFGQCDGQVEVQWELRCCVTAGVVSVLESEFRGYG